MHLTKVYGGAGCGKTYYLTHKIVEVLDAGAHPRDICMVTFTRNARDEFVRRVKDLTGKNDDDLKWFSTMHSIVYSLLSLEPSDIMNDVEKTRFKAEYHIKGAKVNKLDSLNQKRRDCLLSNSRDGITTMLELTGDGFWYASGNPGGDHVTVHEVIQFADAYMLYMTLNHKYDYTRMIEECYKRVSVGSISITFSHLFVDEFQDFSPLQYNLFEKLAHRVEEVWICGDDHQSIYRFSGSSPHFLIDCNHDVETILPRTYRFGSEILFNSSKYVDRMSIKKERSVSPAPHAGSVTLLKSDTWLNHVNDHDGDTVYLVRANKHVRDITTALASIGVECGKFGKGGGKLPPTVKLYNTILQLDRGENVKTASVKSLLKSLPAVVDKRQYLRRGVKSKISSFATDPVYSAQTFAEKFLFGGVWDPQRVVDNASGVSDMLFDNSVAFPDTVEVDIKHFVGTIHKFKGNEADNVFLFTQLPFPISDRIMFDPLTRDEELRTFYVGATRARNNLYEVNDYLFDGNGSLCMNVDQIR